MNMECNLLENVQQGKGNYKKVACMKFHDETKLLYIETDASGVGLGAALLQTRSKLTFHSTGQ